MMLAFHLVVPFCHPKEGGAKLIAVAGSGICVGGNHH
jgi:hypothetical protein